MARHHYTPIILLAALCLVVAWSAVAWPWLSGQDKAVAAAEECHIERFDRVLDEYVSLGSYNALHRMYTQYPAETKLLIEDLLALGRITDADMEQHLRHYYLDSTVQTLVSAARDEYADMTDIEQAFAERFSSLRRDNPAFRQPRVCTFISCLRESIVVTDTLIGISLDKYLGSDFPLYADYFTPSQRNSMNRQQMVDDAITAYLRHLNLQ